MEKFRVGIIGATGMVGQRFILLTANHPWFTPVVLAASAHSAGKTYAQAIGDKWHMAEPIPESVKSMVVMDAEADAEEIVAAATETAAAVVTGCVSRASRDADAGAVCVHSGDFIGFVGDDIRADRATRNEAALALAETLPTADCGAMLLLVGADASEEEAQTLCRALEKTYPHTEFIMINGGQPVYDYMLILE